MIKGITEDVLKRVYDFSEMTNEELRCKFFQKLEECIDLCNNSSDILEWVKKQGLEDEVNKLLKEWLDDGTLENLININKLNKKVDNEVFQNAITNLESTKANVSEVNSKIEANTSEVNAKIDTINENTTPKNIILENK